MAHLSVTEVGRQERKGQMHLSRVYFVINPSYVFSYSILTKIILRFNYAKNKNTLRGLYKISQLVSGGDLPDPKI